MVHQVPKEYRHYIKFTVDSIGHLKRMMDYFHCDDEERQDVLLIPSSSIRHSLELTVEAIPLTGKIILKGIDVYLHNQEKQEKYYLWFKSRADYEKILLDYADIIRKQQGSRKHKLYRMSINGNWNSEESYATKSREMFVGYHHYLDTIIRDIKNYIKHQEFLRSLGGKQEHQLSVVRTAGYR